MQAMVILDRDGVINQESNDHIKRPDEWQPISGSLEAIARLKKAGVMVTVATNQSGIGLGLFDEASLDKIHNKMRGLLAQRGVELDGIYFCPHRPNENCVCRKPKPGLLLKVAQEHGIDLAETYHVGDRFSDVQAARLAGAKPALVKTGSGIATIEKHGPLDDVPQFDDLVRFVRKFLKDRH